MEKSGVRLQEAADEDFSIGLDLFPNNPFIKPRDEFVDPTDAALLLSFGVGLDSGDRTTKGALGLQNSQEVPKNYSLVSIPSI